MGIVKDLTFFGVENKNEKENVKKKSIFYHHGLIGSIVGILSNFITNDDYNSNEVEVTSKDIKSTSSNNFEMIKDKIPEYASKALWNLATVRTLQMVMVDNVDLINILIKFSTNNNEKISHNCISAIGNIVSAPEMEKRLSSSEMVTW